MFGAVMITVALVGLTSEGRVSGTDQATMTEADLKAEFVNRFIHFVDWPAVETGSNTSERFVIGIIGETSVEESLRLITAEAGGALHQQIQVRRIDDPRDVGVCQVLYIAETEADRLTTILAHAGGRPILTVGDTEGFAEAGVLINFYREGDYLRFEINKVAVDRTGLKFSAHLLRLARLVEGN